MKTPRIGFVLILLFLVFPVSGALSENSGTDTRGHKEFSILDKDGKKIWLYKESHALVVGISDYRKGWPDVPGIKNDIRAVSEVLEAQGFHVKVVENPSQTELENAFRNFILTHGLKPENRLLFYFAGHGYTHKPSYAVKDPDEWMGYIVSRDAPDPRQDLPGFFRHALSMQNMEEMALKIESKHAIFVFDSCFSGSVFAFSRAIPRDIRERTSKPVRQFITAGNADQQIPDISIFRRQFTAALSGEGDKNKDGYLTGTELGMYLEETVTNLSRGSQTPQYGKIRHRRLNKGDFVFPLQAPQGTEVASSGSGSGEETALDRLLREVKKKIFKKEEREKNIESHFAKLQELDGVDESLVSRSVKIKSWQDFIKKYPEDNPRLDEANKRLLSLKGSDKGKAVQKRYREILAKVETMDSYDGKASLWKEFVAAYPDNNPRLKEAKGRIQELEKQIRLEGLEKQYALLLDKEKKVKSPEDKIRMWKGFTEKYPDRNPHLKEANEKLEEIRKEKKVRDEYDKLVKLDKDSASFEEKAGRWKKFIEQYPKDNPRLKDAKAKQKKWMQKNREKNIEEQVASILSLDKKEATLEEKQAAWQGFLTQFPEKNSRTEFARKKLKQLKKAKVKQEKEKLAAVRKKMEAQRRENQLKKERLAEERRKLEEKRKAVEAKKKKKEQQPQKKLASLVPAPPEEKALPVPAKVSGMVQVPAGEYYAGEVGSLKPVRTQAFYIDTREVTQKEFEQVMGSNPSHFKGADRPVERVTWKQAKEYCSKVGKRLPKMVEWEKAARAGTRTRFYWGDRLQKNKANCDGCGSRWDGNETAPVGSFPPNKLGLYDMAGNVWEWVEESHDELNKYLRGGSWLDDTVQVQSDGTYFVRPDNRSYDIGFRCVSDRAPSPNQKLASLKPVASRARASLGGTSDGMVRIAAGEYYAGGVGSLKPVRTKTFFIDAREVTQKEYEKVMGNNPSHFKGADRPVERVTWHDARQYCEKLGKRLPKMAEWEKAARAGTRTRFYWGDKLGNNQANCDGCGSRWDGRKTAPVGSFPPNQFGLYDMAGNVWEWVDESHDEHNKYLRGGSWLDDSSNVQSDGTYFVRPDNKSYDIGFRCAK